MIVLAGVFSSSKIFFVITGWSEAAAQLRDSETVWTPARLVSSVEVWAFVVDS